MIPYFENQLQTYLENHQLQLHLTAKLELAAAKTYDGVIVATGAEYQQSRIPGNAVKLSLAELLQKPVFPGKRALVVDDLGDEKAVVACRHLCQHGYQVVLVTTAAYQAAKLVKLGEFSAWYGEMAALGILEKANARVVSADVEQLVLADVYTAQQEALAGVDVVIEIAAPKVQDDLWQALQRQGVPCVCVGDAVAPRGLAAALREGYAAAIGW